MTWRLGILTDRAGHVHLGAVVAGTNGSGREYVDLLAPLGADAVEELDLERLWVLVHGEQLADLRRVAVQCIEDARLRRRIVALTHESAVSESAPATAG